ncbi:hypothetical protein SDRG_11330 [Saprolegnia diclina VS20]|uniref:Protein phosphatase n=1 Tax=Saprolegnia diclina (strain VS20) TaxID=1156394 RepID=T0REZ0_SAPDV|nr:hypothetical protein SDRG_11330 [Saprolegnia diclina VS20]EQC30848.1 hypothetical protein SDRG_11330 [Saprolegnia diclina VS20]|eukprot:XP_008615586.1 hypothetical protein SDRG_11330 [Saprolegnia diclina VS20]
MPSPTLRAKVLLLHGSDTITDDEDEWLPTTPTSTVVTDDSPVVEHGANMTTLKRRKPLLHRFFGRKASLDVSYGSASYVYHGEDAMAVGSYYHVVADGVSASGSEETGRPSRESPSALLARTLVDCVEKALVQYETFLVQCPNAGSTTGFQDRVLSAISLAQSQLTFAPTMASTLVVCYIDRRARCLYTFCVGDSKAIVVRKGRVVYETFAVLKEFNAPAVVNAKSVSRFMVQTLSLQSGDRLVTFSDGVGDNVFKADLCALVAPSHPPRLSAKSKMLHASAELPSSLCSSVAHAALANDGHDWREYPFSVAAAKEYVGRVGRSGGCAEKKIAATLKAALKDTPATFDRSIAACPAEAYTHHYALAQVQRMASLTHKKPDDISICLSVFA